MTGRSEWDGDMREELSSMRVPDTILPAMDARLWEIYRAVRARAEKDWTRQGWFSPPAHDTSSAATWTGPSPEELIWAIDRIRLRPQRSKRQMKTTVRRLDRMVNRMYYTAPKWRTVLRRLDRIVNPPELKKRYPKTRYPRTLDDISSDLFERLLYPTIIVTIGLGLYLGIKALFYVGGALLDLLFGA